MHPPLSTPHPPLAASPPVSLHSQFCRFCRFCRLTVPHFVELFVVRGLGLLELSVCFLQSTPVTTVDYHKRILLTSYFSSHFSRSLSDASALRSKCSAFTSTSRSLCVVRSRPATESVRETNRRVIDSDLAEVSFTFFSAASSSSSSCWTFLVRLLFSCSLVESSWVTFFRSFSAASARSVAASASARSAAILYGHSSIARQI